MKMVGRFPSGKVTVSGTTEQSKKDSAEFQTIVG
jgi:hypothetical protein